MRHRLANIVQLCILIFIFTPQLNKRGEATVVVGGAEGLGRKRGMSFVDQQVARLHAEQLKASGANKARTNKVQGLAVLALLVGFVV